MAEMTNPKADSGEQWFPKAGSSDQWWLRFIATFLAAFVLMLVAVGEYKDVPTDWERCFAKTSALLDEQFSMQNEGVVRSVAGRIKDETQAAALCGGL